MIITVYLEGLENVLKTRKCIENWWITNTNANVYVGVIDDVDGWYKIKELKYHENTCLWKTSQSFGELFNWRRNCG
jgi:hypothetical protein